MHARRCTWPLGHLVLAVAYTLVWLIVPRNLNITGRGLHPTVLGHLLHAMTYPFSGLMAIVAKGEPIVWLHVIYPAALATGLGGL